ncbi:hypothetical protein PINS_up004757 [Pythium insidiosum]|nr:hypothetical protein PINS_up004757 [Pythium insidiosum]
MPSKNEIVPLTPSPTASASVLPPSGPTRSAVGMPVPSRTVARGVRNDAANLEATNAQERRIRLVAAQRRHTAFQLFYALFGLVLMIVQLEYVWFANTKGLSTPCVVDAVTQCPRCREHLREHVPVTEGRMILHALRVLISFSTAILLYYVYAFYDAECEVMKIKNILPPRATLLSSTLRGRLLLELLLFAVHPIPGLESVDPQWPSLVVAASLLMFSRVSLLARVVKFRNSFNTSNGWFIGALTNVDFTTTYFLKSTLKNHPTACILVAFALLLAITGYALFVVERFLCAFLAGACCSPMAFDDALWALVMTVLTVGYGDVVPSTGVGRFLAFLAGLCGTLCTAVTIAVMSNYLGLTRSEHKVNAFLKKDENRRLINDHAARAIQASIHLRAMQRRQQSLGQSQSHASSQRSAKAKRIDWAVQRAETKLFAVLRVYRQVKRFVNSQDVSDPMDKQMTMLEMMEVNVEYIRTKIEDLSQLFHTQIEKSRSRHRLVGSVPSSTIAAKIEAAAISNATAITGAAAAVPAVATTGATPAASGPAMPASSLFPGAGVLASTSTGVAAPSTASSKTPSAPASVVFGPASSAVAISLSSSVTKTPPLSTPSSRPTSPESANRSSSSLVVALTNGSAPKHGVPGQTTHHEFDDDDDDALHSRLRLRSPSPESGHRPLPPVLSGATTTTSLVGPSIAAESAASLHEIPEWALLMESTLQTILMQVARVSNDVEALQTHVETQLNGLHTRLHDLERRLTVQDAFREIARASLVRTKSMRRGSTADPSSTGDAGDGATNGGADPSSSSAPTGAAAGSSSPPVLRHGGGGSFVLSALSSRTSNPRPSIVHRTPSIKSFVTTKDLEEFHSGNMDDK